VQKELRLLSRIKLDGRQIAFEHGLLLCYQGADDRTQSWHVMLLRVAVQDVLCTRPASKRECTVLAMTLDGEWLSGRVRRLPFRSLPDCLRLIGTSPLEDGGRQRGSVWEE
jgi:hypothetical protein